MKKERTPEEQAVINARMAKARAGRKKNPTVVEEPDVKDEHDSTDHIDWSEAKKTVFPNLTPSFKQPELPEGSITLDQGNYDALLRQIEELRDMQWKLARDALGEDTRAGQASATGGKLTGTYERYLLGADNYPDPTSRLTEEQKLRRFAFPINYELNFSVSETSYTTIDGIRTKEPKFTLELIRVIMDEETGDPTNGRYVICQLIMHEDPDTALAIAKERGLDVEADDERTFLNEMRYIRMREWLLDCFYPPVTGKKNERRDMVIDGRLVQYFEVNNESHQDMKIDFSKLPKVKF